MGNSLLKGLTALTSGLVGPSRLSVFAFHRVLEMQDPLFPGIPDKSRFANIIDWICAQFSVLDPVDACQRLSTNSLPPASAVITFDDGYRDNYLNALPIMQARKINGAFFIATGYLNGTMMFNDILVESIRRTKLEEIAIPDTSEKIPLNSLENKRQAIFALVSRSKYLAYDARKRFAEMVAESTEVGDLPTMMMDESQVLEMSKQGMRIGGHTRRHPILLSCSDKDAQKEIVSGRDDIKQITSTTPELFAYPNGKRGEDYLERHVDMVSNAGFSFAFTTHPGASSPGSDLLQIKRFTPWDKTQLRFGLRSINNLIHATQR